MILFYCLPLDASLTPLSYQDFVNEIEKAIS